MDHTRTGSTYSYGMSVASYAPDVCTCVREPIRVWAKYLYGTEDPYYFRVCLKTISVVSIVAV